MVRQGNVASEAQVTSRRLGMDRGLQCLTANHRVLLHYFKLFSSETAFGVPQLRFRSVFLSR